MIFDEVTAPIAQPGVAPAAGAKPIAKWSEVQLYWGAWIERSKPKLQQAATAALAATATRATHEPVLQALASTDDDTHRNRILRILLHCLIQINTMKSVE